MIIGAHALIYTSAAEEVRTFLGEVLGFKSVDAGGGWPIFALPPAEVAVHPTDGASLHELYLMCDDIEATIAELTGKGIECSPVSDEGWGLRTVLTLPGGTELGMYEPRHPRP
ncbi:MAG: extradiol dioxygenase [Actinobacteria bacterium 13_2_20CM_2_71_6]|nr:MAG: extradiol dioxygenase [Actinobacteria bacterium 13_2_20CM_2_71_6]